MFDGTTDCFAVAPLALAYRCLHVALYFLPPSPKTNSLTVLTLTYCRFWQVLHDFATEEGRPGAHLFSKDPSQLDEKYSVMAVMPYINGMILLMCFSNDC